MLVLYVVKKVLRNTLYARLNIAIFFILFWVKLETVQPLTGLKLLLYGFWERRLFI